MWWRKRQLAWDTKFESFRRVLRRSYLWRSFGSLEGLSGLPSNNQGGIQLPWWCNTQFNSMVKFRNENYKWRHINSNWRNGGFVLRLLKGPPLHIRNYVVITGHLMLFERYDWFKIQWLLFIASGPLFRFSQKFAYSCNNSYSNTTSDVQ